MLRKVSVAINVLRKNGFLGELQCLADNPPTLKMEDSANIKMVLQGTFKKNVVDRWKHYVEFDPVTDALQPVLTINGIKYELGIFLPTTVTPSYKDTAVEETIEIEAYDRSWLVATTTGIERVFFSRGTPYMEAIEQLLVASGITLINSTPCTEILNEDREDWDLGTDYLTIINDLLKEINYKQLWFDNTGTAIIEPIDTPMVQNIKHTLDARNVTSLVHPGLSRKLDIYSTPNVFICTCNNPEKSAVLTAIARNENNHSPLSIQRRGREIVYYENVNNVASQDALQAYVDRLLFISLMSGESLSVTTSLLPDWGIGDIVSLHYLDVHALCVSHSWNMTLAAGGTMTHELEKIVYNLDPEIYGDDVSDESDDEHLVPYTPWDDDDNDDNNDDDNDNNDDTNLPDEIRIITLPNKLQYASDDPIDLTGIAVYAYRDGSLWTSKQYPNGLIPEEELNAVLHIDEEPDSGNSFVYYPIPAGTVLSDDVYWDNTFAYTRELHFDSDVAYIDLMNGRYTTIEYIFYSRSPFTITYTVKFADGSYQDDPHHAYQPYENAPIYILKIADIDRTGVIRYAYDILYNATQNVYYEENPEITPIRFLADHISEFEKKNPHASVVVSWPRPKDKQILTIEFDVSISE